MFFTVQIESLLYFYFWSIWPNNLEHVWHIAICTGIIFTKFKVGQPICFRLITFYCWFITSHWELDLWSFDGTFVVYLHFAVMWKKLYEIFLKSNELQWTYRDLKLTNLGSSVMLHLTGSGFEGFLGFIRPTVHLLTKFQQTLTSSGWVIFMIQPIFLASFSVGVMQFCSQRCVVTNYRRHAFSYAGRRTWNSYFLKICRSQHL